MPRAAKKELEDFWNFADKNGDGKLTIQEFKAAVMHYHKGGAQANCSPPSDRMIADMFTSMNDNNDTFLQKAEYMKHVDAEENNIQNLKKAFQAIDKDGDGSITRDELKPLLLKSGFKASQLQQIFDACDTDGDGTINFEEFIKAL